MKILYVTTIGSTMGFFRNLIKELLDEGNIVDIATNDYVSKVPNCYYEWGCRIFHISTSRSPFSFGNIKAIKQIREIAKSYDLVHCHTPLAGMATRIGCKKLRKKNNLKVVYTAHGFHFYKGAPLINWLLYYPIEKICSKWTDLLITINHEDYSFSKKNMKAKKIIYVPGVGVDTSLYSNTFIDKKKKKEELSIPQNSIVVLSVGELNDNKNHISVIKAINEIPDKEKYYYVIAGDGINKNALSNQAKKMNINLLLLGIRRDVAELYKIADIYVHPSKREGLPVAVMEALSSGCKCITSNIRGCSDLVCDCYRFYPNDYIHMSELILSSLNSKYLKKVDLKMIDKHTINSMMKKEYFTLKNGSINE